MRPLPHAKLPMLLAAAMGLALVVVSACGSNPNGSPTGSGTLTIQGDNGNPTLVENFNPFQGSALHGFNLIYEPLEIPSPIDGSYTQFLATVSEHEQTNSATDRRQFALEMN